MVDEISVLCCFFAMLTMRVPQLQPSLTSPGLDMGKQPIGSAREGVRTWELHTPEAALPCLPLFSSVNEGRTVSSLSLSCRTVTHLWIRR
jgi:hypothetical protein